jgi:hypothetical protein
MPLSLNAWSPHFYVRLSYRGMVDPSQSIINKPPRTNCGANNNNNQQLSTKIYKRLVISSAQIDEREQLSDPLSTNVYKRYKRFTRK